MTAGSGHASSTTTRFSFVCTGSFGMSRGTGFAAFGMRPKYCVTRFRVFCRSKSPTMAMTAFSGT